MIEKEIVDNDNLIVILFNQIQNLMKDTKSKDKRLEKLITEYHSCKEKEFNNEELIKRQKALIQRLEEHLQKAKKGIF